MTRLVKTSNTEYVRLTDWEGRKPRRKARMWNLTRVLFRGFLSKLVEQTKLRKLDDTDANQAASEPLILKIPVEVLRIILGHLTPIDRTVLRYTCKPLYCTIRAAADGFPYVEEDKLAKMRVAARLLDSNLCPRIKDSTGTRCLSRDELVAAINSEFACKLCEEFWPSEGRNAVRCPFHVNMPGGKDRSALSSSMRRVVNPLSWRRPYWERHPPSTFDELVGIIKKEASRVTTGHCNHFSASYVSSWTAALLQMETALYKHQNDDPIFNPNPNTPTAHNARLNNEIVTLTCCSHCMNVIVPDSEKSSPSCPSCGCTQCGWTDVRMLRFPESVQGGFRVRYIPLGDVSQSRRKTKGKVAGLKRGRDERGRGRGRMLYGIIRFGKRGLVS